MYKTNWKIDFWKAWRASVGKPPLKESPDKQFYVIVEDDFKEYCTFCDSLPFFLPVPKGSYVIPQSQLLSYYMANNKVDIAGVDLYGSRFYVLSEDMLQAFAYWIEMKSVPDY